MKIKKYIYLLIASLFKVNVIAQNEKISTIEPIQIESVKHKLDKVFEYRMIEHEMHFANKSEVVSFYSYLPYGVDVMYAYNNKRLSQDKQNNYWDENAKLLFDTNVPKFLQKVIAEELVQQLICSYHKKQKEANRRENVIEEIKKRRNSDIKNGALSIETRMLTLAKWQIGILEKQIKCIDKTIDFEKVKDQNCECKDLQKAQFEIARNKWKFQFDENGELIVEKIESPKTLSCKKEESAQSKCCAMM